MRDPTTVAYAIFGIALSAGGAAFAWMRGRARPSFYAADVYHMTARSHRRFALGSAGFVLLFALAIRWPVLEIPGLTVYILALVFYATSFARGFSDDE